MSYGELAGSAEGAEWSTVDYLNPLAWGQWAGETITRPMTESRQTRQIRGEVIQELGTPALALGHRVTALGERATDVAQRGTRDVAMAVGVAAVVAGVGVFVAWRVLK